jgi:hypothetical protein
MVGNGLGLWRSMIFSVLTCSFCVKTKFQFLLATAELLYKRQCKANILAHRIFFMNR